MLSIRSYTHNREKVCRYNTVSKVQHNSFTLFYIPVTYIWITMDKSARKAVIKWCCKKKKKKSQVVLSLWGCLRAWYHRLSLLGTFHDWIKNVFFLQVQQSMPMNGQTEMEVMKSWKWWKWMARKLTISYTGKVNTCNHGVLCKNSYTDRRVEHCYNNGSVLPHSARAL